MSAPSGSPSATITVAYDDDATAAAEALLAVLRRPANPNPDHDDGDPARDAA